MKDAHGHGSDSQGMANRLTAGHHQAGVLRVGRPGGVKVQGLNTGLTGVPWETLGRYGNRAVAEKTAQNMRIDGRSDLVRVR